jgi:hypothetical protein
VLEDLAAYQVLTRLPDGRGKADRWRVADTFTPYLDAVPEMSGDAMAAGVEEPNDPSPLTNQEPTYDDISGMVSGSWAEDGA